MNTAETTPIDWNARIREQYTNPVAAVARVMREETELAQLDRARYMISIARNPQGRFDLQSSDVPASVFEALEEIVSSLAPVGQAFGDAVRALAQRFVKLEQQGFASDEIWGQLEEQATPLGFHYGDSQILRAWA